MYVQYGPNLPAVRLDGGRGRLFFNTTGDMSQELELFYSHYLADDFWLGGSGFGIEFFIEIRMLLR